MVTIGIQEKFIMQFVCGISEYERCQYLLAKLNAKCELKDVTKETHPLRFAEGRPEVEFNIVCKDVTEAAFFKAALHRV